MNLQPNNKSHWNYAIEISEYYLVLSLPLIVNLSYFMSGINISYYKIDRKVIKKCKGFKGFRIRNFN